MMDMDDPELEALRKRRMDELRKLADARQQAPDADGAVHPMTDAAFASFVQRNRVAFVDFWAPWCGPCRAVSPLVEQLAKQYAGRVAFAKVNTDENPATSQEFGVQSIPFLVVFRNGRAVDGVVGAQPKAALQAALEPYL